MEKGYLDAFPTNKGEMHNESSVGMYVHHAYLFFPLSVPNRTESALINKLWPKFWSKKLVADFSELSRNLLRGIHYWLGYFSAIFR